MDWQRVRLTARGLAVLVVVKLTPGGGAAARFHAYVTQDREQTMTQALQIAGQAARTCIREGGAVAQRLHQEDVAAPEAANLLGQALDRLTLGTEEAEAVAAGTDGSEREEESRDAGRQQGFDTGRRLTAAAQALRHPWPPR